jgi:hypothetical protein
VLIDELDEDDPSELTTEELRQEVERLRKLVEAGDLDDDPSASDGGGLAKFPPNGLGFEDGALPPSRLRTGACVPNHPTRLLGHEVTSSTTPCPDGLWWLVQPHAARVRRLRHGGGARQAAQV